ncbi:hypothetical protein BBJ28_00010615 [Nothophytophthora sp. Chile5]|nr:hypothetical protein BBJ28_00010615 [Nothophytophthora sp. Chile5]
MNQQEAGGGDEAGGREDDAVAATQMGVTATRSKLDQLMNGFSTFDDVMRVGTRQRREKDEHRLAEMKQEMNRLELKLEAEIKKRIEMNKSLQNYCDEKVSQMTAAFETLLSSRATQVNDRLDRLTHEISDLQSLVEKEKRDIPLLIENKTNELTQKLAAFMDAFEDERQRRSAQEAALLKRFGDHEHATAEAFERERHDRELKYSELKNALDSYTSTRIRGDERFHTFAQDEIAKIQNALVTEAQVSVAAFDECRGILVLNVCIVRSAKAREREDDEIVEALNRYTAKLQESLKVITSPDA